MDYILSIPMCLQNSIAIFHSVQEIGPFSLFQNLELGKTSPDEKLYFTISWARSCHYQCLRRSLIKIFHSVQEITPFSLFQNLALAKASTDDKCQFAIVSLFSAKTQPISNVIWLSHGVHLVNINIYAKFHHNIPLSSRDRAISTFSEIGPRQNLTRCKMIFHNLRIWSSAKPRPMKKCHFAIYWARSCQYQCIRNSLSKYSTQFKRKGHFHFFFWIWRSAKPRPMTNVILQFLELGLVNINVSAKFNQNIQNGLRVKFHFFFQNLNLGKTSTNPNCICQSHSYIFSIPMCVQNFITIFHSVQEIGPFSVFQNLELGKTSPDEKWYFTISWARSCHYQCLRRSLIKIFHSVQEITFSEFGTR